MIEKGRGPTDEQIRHAAEVLAPVLDLSLDAAIDVLAVALRVLFDASAGRFDERTTLTVRRMLNDHGHRLHALETIARVQAAPLPSLPER